MDTRPFEDIEALPRWAAVAFAARCARRVLPLLKRDWDIPRNLVQIVRFELRHAETAAGLAKDLPVPDETLATCQRVLDAASRAETSGSRIGPQVAMAVHQAFISALDPSERDRTSPLGCPPHVVAAEQAAIFAQKVARALEAQEKLSGVEHCILTGMRGDIELLQESSRQKAWTHDTPIPGVFFPSPFPKPYPTWLCATSTGLEEDEKPKEEEACRLFQIAWNKKGLAPREYIPYFEESAFAFQQLAEQFRERPDYLYNSGTCLLQLADYDHKEHRIEDKEQKALAAINRIARAIEISDFAPEYRVRPAPAANLSKHHHNLGHAIRHLGRQDEPAAPKWRMLALAEYLRALALDPSNSDARSSLEGADFGILHVLPEPLPPFPYELMLIGPPFGT